MKTHLAVLIFVAGFARAQNVQAPQASIPVGLSATTTSGVTITSASTDMKIAEIAMTSGYLNLTGRVAEVEARGTYTTAGGQTPTATMKLKLCTVSGCGSGTALTLYATPATGATTAAATNTWFIKARIATTLTGSTGTVLTHAEGCVVLGASASTACTPSVDSNTASSSAIDLTAALFLDIVWQFSTGTTNTVAPHLFSIQPKN